ncbi:MAG: AAA family ATPase [Muribaculaceae bacterium]|nr:AAA family ATPase [Muribaculaceae bacterium]
MHNIDLDNPEFQNVWKLVSYTRQSVFLTGKAGTGKSTFLRYICANTRKNYVILAPTGIAAVNVGGVTMHSFFRIPLKPLLPDDPEFAVNRLRSRMKYPKELRKIIKSLELIIIDEISMVRADVIDFMDKLLRVYSGNMREPFGGKQLLLVGDVFQLEPVVTHDMRELLRKHYPDSFFFNAHAFSKINIVPIELRKIYRQKDSDFISMLDRIRVGHPSQQDIMRLNSRVVRAEDTASGDSNVERMVMTLATRRDMVDCINEEHLNRLRTPEITYYGYITGEFPENSLPTSMELTLKVGAQVVFIKNDRSRRWVNGTIGRVCRADDSTLEVELEDGSRYEIEPEKWGNIRYEYDEKSKRVIEKEIGAFTQFPLKLAWALTVHKSQGLTFNNVIIDMGRGAFSSGQSYVALSRCTSFEGMILRSSLTTRDIFVNPAIVAFSKGFNDTSSIDRALQRAHADDCYHQAAEAFDNGDMETAVDKFVEAMKSRSEIENKPVMRLVRRKLSVIPRLQSEIEAYRRVLDEHSSRFRSLAREYVMMGDDCLHEAADYTPAIANYDKALSLDPECVPAMYGKGLALMDAGDDAGAEECFRNVLAIDASDYNAAFQLGNIFMKRDELYDALNWYLLAIDCNGKEPAAHTRVADLYERIGEETLAGKHRKIASRLRSPRRPRKK